MIRRSPRGQSSSARSLLVKEKNTDISTTQASPNFCGLRPNTPSYIKALNKAPRVSLKQLELRMKNQKEKNKRQTTRDGSNKKEAVTKTGKTLTKRELSLFPVKKMRRKFKQRNSA